MAIGALLSCWLLTSATALQERPESVTPRGGPLSLPAGRVAALLEEVDLGGPKKTVAPAWPEWSERSASGWGGALPWQRWLELVRAEARADAPDPSRRAALAVLARLQGRDGAAWEHLVACARSPELVRGVLPLFVPGVPQALLGQPGPLPDGVLLRPALPPCDDPASPLRRLAGSALDQRELEIGTARCSLHVAVEGDGVEVTLRHVGGGAARVALEPPLPLGIQRGQLFADWEKRTGEPGAVEFRLDAEANEHTLWLTFQPQRERWPAPRPDELTAASGRREIVLVSPRGDEPHLARCAEALGALLGVRASLAGEGFRAAPGPEPLVVHLGDDPSSEHKLAQLVGLAEAFLLTHRSR